jgi:two-component system response regulator HydG
MNKILIVEDEDIIRTALKKLLLKNGFDVVDANSIDQAKQYRFRDFDLIISDQRLPGGQGTDLIALAPHTPVLIMTSYASMRSAVDAMKLGAVDYIAKPFDHKEMVETVTRILASSASLITKPIEVQRSTLATGETHAGDVAASEAVTLATPAVKNVSLDDYFIQFVRENEGQFSETELARQLGISRKNLWERRQKLGIPRKK